MEEESKQRIAQFRFGVIHELVGGRRLSRGERRRLLREKSSSEWDIPCSGRSHISVSTLLNWARRYENSGRRLESLYPDEREDKGSTRAMDEDTALILINLKKKRPAASLPVLIREAKREKLLPIDFKASPATIYRLFNRHGLMEDLSAPVDRRRFEAELPNDIWQSDCMHGPKVEIDGKLRKTYLFAFLDDMSRLVPHAEFYLHERIDSYVDALQKALRKRGLPRKLYVDNGPTFRCRHLDYATASLGIALIHSKPYQPQGRGKIERWFKTVRTQFLSVVRDGLSLEELNRGILHWIDTHYHQSVHSSTKELPFFRFINNLQLERGAPTDLNDYFRKRLTRKVDKDRTVAMLGRAYEAPVELIGKTVTLLYHELDPSRIEVFCNNASYGMLVPLALNINCKIRRDQHITEIIPRQEHPEEINTERCYTGGKLFDKGDRNRDEL